MVDTGTYVDLIAAHGRRENMPIAPRESVGADLEDREERELRAFAELAKHVGGQRKGIEQYVDRAIRELAPNVSELTGPLPAPPDRSATSETRSAFPASARPSGAAMAARRHRPRSRGQHRHGRSGRRIHEASDRAGAPATPRSRGRGSPSSQSGSTGARAAARPEKKARKSVASTTVRKRFKG